MLNLKEIIPSFLLQIHHKKRVLKRYGKGNVLHSYKIGKNVTLGNELGGVYLSENVELRDNVTIGAHSYCNKGTIVFKGSQIGNYCSIGYNVHIGPPEHPVNFFSTSPDAYRSPGIKDLCNWPKDDIHSPVVVGNDVWIGSNAIILQGCTIGDGVVIAAGAVVTHDIPPYTVVGGVPAKKIKDRFTPSLSQKLLDSQWWKHDENWIAEFFHGLPNSNYRIDSND